MKPRPPTNKLSYKRSQKLVLPVDQLEPGMYVAQLDRPWEETPFLFQGFVVENQADIETLKTYCNTVTVDILSSVDYMVQARKPGASRRETTTRVNKRLPVEQALPKAHLTYQASKQTMRSIMDDVRLGKSIDTPAAKAAVSEAVDNVLENPDALTLLTRMRSKDEYTSEHSLSVCILSIALGRSLQMSREQLNELGMCALLHDVGKIMIPDNILSKPGPLTAEENRVMQSHTSEGRDIVLANDGLPKSAPDVCHAHHERLDGSGYPRGLQVEQITYFSKLVSITDSFDAITSDRVYRMGQTNMSAFKILTKGRGRHYDPDLVFQFIETLGIYPPGTVTVLSSGETAVVIETHPKLKLRPKMLIVKDPHNPAAEMRVIDLAKVAHDRHGQRLFIAQVKHAKEAGVDLDMLKQSGLLSSI